MNSLDSTVVIVPGLRDHDPDHWQSHLARDLPSAAIVPPLTADKLDRAARVAALDAVLAGIDGPSILVAHSAGVLTAVHWAAANPASSVIGALLVTPADIESPLPTGYPLHSELDAGGWLPIPRTTLPFTSIVVASQSDPLASMRRVAGMAENWGAHLLDAGDVGHLNPAAGYGPWPPALGYLAMLRADIAATEALVR
ncbi:alpha/beta hydrolase [Gordonia sp. TBRC 11910]|uniref:Alpha/beta hydrolase n=1 Tax=Gordonia asplenii TaxID=2725283 RepID=A0A848LBD7_9ACTN|nr:alpha/beta hydrolase [Gordonia asplenii]NMO04898.1 alpha/beta hydrolase [Gordonia asplenii]